MRSNDKIKYFPFAGYVMKLISHEMQDKKKAIKTNVYVFMMVILSQQTMNGKANSR